MHGTSVHNFIVKNRLLNLCRRALAIIAGSSKHRDSKSGSIKPQQKSGKTKGKQHRYTGRAKQMPQTGINVR
jgi:hypothetical protein